MQKKRTVLVFGAFDVLHTGHRFFLREARKYGNRLIAVVAHDKIVKELKNKKTREPLQKRLAGLHASGLVNEVCAGDKILGRWSAVRNYKPDIIALGYDQTELEKELRAYVKKENLPLMFIRLPALKPDRLHSRFLHNQ
jgi:FAD synthetase